MSQPERLLFLSTARDVTGGAEEGMLSLLKYYPTTALSPLMVAPGGGELEQRVRDLGIGFHPWNAPELPMGVRGTKIPRFALGVTRGRRDLTRLLETAPPALVTTHSMEAHVLGSAIAAPLDRPVVWHVRDIHTETGERWALRWGARFRRPTCVFLTEACRMAFPALRAPEHEAVLPDGVDLERFETGASQPVTFAAWNREMPAAAIRDALHIPPNACVIGYVGQVLPRKRVGLLIDAMERMPHAPGEPPVHVLIVGDGPDLDGPGYLPALRARAQASPVADRLHLVGRATPIAPLLTALDVLVLPSLGEALGLVLLEAMAAGLPVIAARDGGMPDIVTHNGTGLLVDPDSAQSLAAAMHRLATHVQERRDMGTAGQDRVRKRFDTRHQAAAMAAIHARVAGIVEGAA